MDGSVSHFADERNTVWLPGFHYRSEKEAIPLKKILIWVRLLTKRLLHKPAFIITLLLIPFLVLLLRGSLQSGDAMLEVALYTESSDPDSLESVLIAKLAASSNHTVHFNVCHSISELQADLRHNHADCGYVFPHHLEQELEKHAKQNHAVITAYHHTGAMETLLLDEMVYRIIYEKLAYEIVKQHIQDKKKVNVTHRLDYFYQYYRQDESFIRFEYADGTGNRVLNQQQSNYLLLPIRGICAVLILLAAMTGTIFWYEDHERKLFLRLSQPTQTILPFFYSLVPAILAGIFGFSAIALTGFSSQTTQEFLSLALFLSSVSAYSMLLRELLPDARGYLAAIPLSVIGSLLFCPVFADVSMALPMIKPLRMLTPVFYYLDSIYSVKARWALLCYSVVTFALALGFRRLRSFF